MAVRDDVEPRALVANEASTRVVDVVDGVEVTRLARAAAVSSTPVPVGMRRAIRREASRTDLFHLHFPYPWGEAAWFASRTKVPSVMTYHSDIVRQRVWLAGYRPLLSRVLDRVDLIIASSPNMVEHSEFLAPRADKCRVIPFGIHTERYQATPEIEARAAELRRGHRRPIVLFVGRLIYYKGADVLVKAMTGVDADLVMIGRGPLEGELRESAVARRISDRVTFLPPVDDDELVAWYHAADVFCLPSVARSEAFGLVQLEAHASGTPVVSTNLTTGVPFVNQHETTGLVVEPGDVEGLASALHSLCSDDALRARLGKAARARALADFTMDRMIEETAAVYREVAGEGSA
jgi:rhamnosyl/mannosyltransferase